jgi:single-strand DNA-binding protein
MGINKAILVGNVGRDPEVQYVREDLPVAKFTLATSETYKDKSGEKVKTTEWHNIVVWRGLAKVVEQYVKKGDQLYIEGKITTRSYEKNGEMKYFTEILVQSMQMLGKSSRTEQEGNKSTQPQTETAPKQEAPVNNEPPQESGDDDFNPEESDDLPF